MFVQHPRRRSLPRLAMVLAALGVCSPRLVAQASATGRDSVPSVRLRPAAPPIRWWHAGLAVAGVGLVALVDHPVRDLAQTHNTATDRSIATSVQRFGEAPILATATVGLMAAGLIARRPGVTRSGIRVAGALATAAIGVEVLKELVGRERPYLYPARSGIHPFSGAASMPSGHTTVAFAFATALSAEIRRPWATAALFTLAGGTGVARVVVDEHWASDVAAAAILGIASAKLATGRWRLFHLRPPTIFATPLAVSLGWSVPLGPGVRPGVLHGNGEPPQ